MILGFHIYSTDVYGCSRSRMFCSSTSCLHEDDLFQIDSNLTVAISAASIKKSAGKITSFNYFGDFATFLTTCIIEYSVIGAAIMFVMWRSIDENLEHLAVRKKKKSKVRIDCR